MINGTLPAMALRLSGQLLLGVSKIYQRKAKYLLEDCGETINRLKLSFKPSNLVDLPEENAKAALAAITLPQTKNMDDLLGTEPDFDLDAILRSAAVPQNIARIQDITMKKAVMSDNYSKMDLGMGFDENDDTLNNLMQEIELGRRATVESRPSESPIEMARRASMNIQDVAIDKEVPFSPMRTPQKLLPEDAELNFFEDGPGFDELAEIQGAPEAVPNLLFRSPAAESIQVIHNNISPVPAKIQTKRVVKRNASLMDTVTEMPNSQIQAQIRDTSSIILEDDEDLDAVMEKSPFGGSSVQDFLAAPSVNTLLTREIFGVLFEKSSDKRSAEPNTLNEINMMSPARSMQNRPLEGLEFADDGYAGDAGADIWDNQVPDMVSVKAASIHSRVASPIKSKIARKSSIISQDHALLVPEMPLGQPPQTFSKSTVEVVEQWRQLFSGSKTKCVDFNQMARDVGNGSSPVVSRQQAAFAFFEILVLHTKGFLHANQPDAFGPIQVTANESLFGESALIAQEGF